MNKEEDLPEAMARLMNVAGAEDRRQFERVVMSGYRQEYVSVVIITGRKRCGTGTEAHPVWDLERVMGNKVLLQVREGHADTVAGEGGQLFVIGTDNLAQCIEAISLEL